MLYLAISFMSSKLSFDLRFITYVRLSYEKFQQMGPTKGTSNSRFHAGFLHKSLAEIA